MTRSKLHRFGAAPILMIGLGAPALFASGCDDDALGGNCAADIAVKFEQLSAAVEGLVKVSGQIKGSVAVACANIANDLGAADVPDVGNGSNVSDDDMQAACAAANASLNAELDAGVSISISVAGGKCSVNAEAQFSCEASCSVDGSCDPGTLEARCDPGELSGSCAAECEGSCTVTSGSVECEGKCEGTCSGTCSGGCEGTQNGGTCDGICTGSCSGGCEGTCEVVAPGASCSGSCKGGCSVAYTAPSCEAELKPPSCELDADCQAGCDGQAKFEATCTPPEVIVVISGGASANLQATLEANLPAIFNAFEVQGKLVVDAAGQVATSFGAAAQAIVTVPACALKFGADFAADISGAASASASVSVSVSASAEVGGTASGG
jgi:hypothetical protein